MRAIFETDRMYGIRDPRNNHYTGLSKNLGRDDGIKEPYQRPFWRRLHCLILLVCERLNSISFWNDSFLIICYYYCYFLARMTLFVDWTNAVYFSYTVEGDEASSWSWRALHLQQLPSSSTSEWAHCHQIWGLTGGTSYLAPDLWMGDTEYSEIVTNNTLSVSR